MTFTSRAFALAFFALFLLSPVQAQVSTNPGAPETETFPSVAFTGAQWFDGKTFRPGTVYSRNGRLTRQMPPAVDSTVDLTGQFVVPPFGDAHVHAFESSNYMESAIRGFLREGIFYARNLNNCRSGREAAADSVNQPWSVDVTYANGGITAPGAHPTFTYEAMALGYRSFADRRTHADEIRKSRLADGDCYFTATEASDIRDIWPQILDGAPDHIKVFLHDSAQYATRQEEGKPPKGLNPELLPLIVEKADSAGLRTIAHVVTPHDVHMVLDAGADEIAHAPGAFINTENPYEMDIDYMMDAETLHRAATSNLAVNPTFYRGIQMIRYMAEDRRPDSTTTAQIKAFHRDVVRTLKKAGVPIVAGADSPGITAMDEALYYHEIGAMDNGSVLRMLSVTTPQQIFPNRSVGCLDDGCEASFLVLNGNPLNDLANLSNIAMRFKEGRFLPLDEP